MVKLTMATSGTSSEACKQETGLERAREEKKLRAGAYSELITADPLSRARAYPRPPRSSIVDSLAKIIDSRRFLPRCQFRSEAINFRPAHSALGPAHCKNTRMKTA